MNLNKQRIRLLVLCFVAGFTIAACAKPPREPTAPPVPPGSVIAQEQVFDGKTFINTLELPAGPYARFGLPKMTKLVHEKHALNSDTVAWLKVPNTTIDDVVVWYPNDRNEFYLRRNFEKRSDFNGIFFADYRCKFDGTAAGLSKNTVIYGHSMSDDPLDYRQQFSPLKFFRDEEFARKTPYIYLSTHGEDLIFEVFSVMHASTGLLYNSPEPEDFNALIAECKARSIYSYDVDVKEGDKILTLSTCTYSLPDGRRFPLVTADNGYRYAVMARLITDRQNLKNESSLAVNRNLKAPEV